MNQNEFLKNLRYQLMRYALSLGCQKDDASDIVHDVLLKVHQKGFLEREEIHLSYFKRMIKNHNLNQKRNRVRFMENDQISRITDSFLTSVCL